MRLIANGHLGNKVRAMLAAERVDFAETVTSADNDGVGGKPTVIVTDSFRPALVEQTVVGAGIAPVLLAFLTTRGVAVTPWLSPAGPCFACFKRRWFSNLRAWEHQAAFERYLERVDEATGTRSFPVPHSVAAMAANLIVDRIHGAPQAVAHYVDLASCEITIGVVMGVHGCACVRERMHARRADLAQLFAER